MSAPRRKREEVREGEGEWERRGVESLTEGAFFGAEFKGESDNFFFDCFLFLFFVFFLLLVIYVLVETTIIILLPFHLIFFFLRWAHLSLENL